MIVGNWFLVMENFFCSGVAHISLVSVSLWTDEAKFFRAIFLPNSKKLLRISEGLNPSHTILSQSF